MPYSQDINLVQPGEPVAAGVVNRPLGTLEDRTNYLFELLAQAATGSTIFARQVVIDPTVETGQPVFFNPATNRFEAALAAATTGIDGIPVAAPSAHVWGIVYAKLSADQADLLLVGYAAVDITAAIEPGQVLAAGLYYLSRSTPGTLTTVKPPVAMPVLRSDGAGNVMVNPAWEDPLTGHVHLYFQLRAAPAGTHTYPGTGNPHVITAPDPSVPGWLPANHAVFNGKAPSRAEFGYNLKADKALSAQWPPLPVSSAVLLKDGVQVQDGNEGLVILDRNGIWWTSYDIGSVPFPDYIHTDATIISDWSQPSDTLPDSHQYEMQLKLYMTKPTFLSDQTVVTSLITTDHRVLITCQNSNTGAATGPLNVTLDLSFLVGRSDVAGYTVFKEFDPALQLFNAGPVASGVYARSSSVLLTGSESDVVTIASSPQTVYRGDVGIDIVNAAGRELFVELVRLDGVEEEYIENVMYLGFDQLKQQSFRGRIHVPETLDVTSPQMQLKFRVLGLGIGTLPPLTLTYVRIPSPGTGIATLPVSDTALSLPISATVSGAFQYVDVVSSEFVVAAGDDVLFTLQRSSSDSYPWQVGIMRQTGLITSV